MGYIKEYQRIPLQSTVTLSEINNAGAPADTLTRVAVSAFEIAKKRERIQNETFISQKAIELENRSQDVFKQWQKDHEADPLGKEDDLKDRLVNIRNEFLEQAPNGEAQRQFSLVSENYHGKVTRQGTDWSDKQLVLNTGRAAQDGLEQLQVKMLREPGTATFKSIIEEGEQVLSPLSQAASKQVVDVAREKFHQNLAANMFESMVQKNSLGEAQATLNSKEFDSYLGADGIQKVQALIETRKKQNEYDQTKLVELKEKNPWEYYQKVGGKVNTIAFDPSIDPTGTALKDSILKREGVVHDAKVKYGVDLPILSPQETKGFVKALKAAGTNETLSFLSFYDKNITDEQKIIISRQVFKEEPSMGIALSISNDAPEDAQKIISGQRLLREEKGEVLNAVYTPKAAGKTLDETFDTYIGNASENPEFRKQIKSAALAHYTHAALRSDKTVTGFDEDLFKKSIAAVSAPVFDVNGRDVFSFRDKAGTQVDADQFDDFITNLKDKDIQTFQGDVPRTAGGEPIQIEKNSGDVSFINDSYGNYFLLYKNRMTLDKKGQPFILKAKDIYDKKPKTWWDAF
jgi:hypothetical protein